MHVTETGSTNTDLLALAAPGGSAQGHDRLVLVADHQTAGRGRLDRRWEAPTGANLLLSLLLRDLPDHPHELTQRVALAAATACRRVAGAHVSLKWPNDLLIGDRKLAGILAQTGSVAGRLDHAVVGLGLNVSWAPPEAACLRDASGDVDRWDLLSVILEAYDELGTVDLPGRYREALATIGQSVRVEMPGDVTVEGRAVSVEDDGRLVVLDDCGITHRIDTGDVVHLRRR